MRNEVLILTLGQGIPKERRGPHIAEGIDFLVFRGFLQLPEYPLFLFALQQRLIRSQFQSSTRI